MKISRPKHNYLNNMDKGKNFYYTVGRKIHKSIKNLQFLKECEDNTLLPKFTEISKKTIIEGKLSPQQIIRLRKQKLTDEIETSQVRLDQNEKKLFEILSKSKFNVDQISTLKTKMFTRISILEPKNDKRRYKILKDLKLKKGITVNDNKNKA